MRYARIVLLAALVAGTACGGDGGDTENGGTENGGGGTTTSSVSMVDNAFEPSDPAVAAGSSLIVTNDGEAAHTFTVADGDIDEQVAPGEETSVTVSLDAGTYDFVCSFHPEMTGTLTVQ
jgi:plastocyanin